MTLSITTLQLVIDAMRDLNALSEGEVPTDDEITDGARYLQLMLQEWSIEGMLIPYQTTETLIGITTKAQYTWGVGQDISSVAPVRVLAVSFQLGNGQQPLTRADARMFNGLPWTGMIGMPTYFTYAQGSPYPTLSFDCFPYGGAFNIVSEKPLIDTVTPFPSALAFPAAYAKALRTNLAIELASQFERQPSPTVVALAVASKAKIKRFNTQPVPSMRTELPGSDDGNLSLPLRN